MKHYSRDEFVAAPDTVNPDTATEVVESNSRQFVTFELAGESFAVEMAPVREIIRIPALVRMPLGPPSLEGIANLRGSVLPMVSLRHILGLPDREQDDASRAIVIDSGQRLGFVVDRVSSVIAVDPSRIEDAEAIGTVDAAFLSGVIKQPGSDEIIMIIDFASVVAREFADIQASAAVREATRAATAAQPGAADTHDESQLVSFLLAGQAYAIDIQSVREIVQLPQALAQLPRTPPCVLGLCTLRDQLLPIVSARALFGLPPTSVDEKCRVVVLALGSMSVGLAVDTVSEILRIASRDRCEVPELLYRGDERAVIASMCKLDGDRLVSVIDVAALFDHRAIAQAIDAAGTDGGPEPAEAIDEPGLDEQLVAFTLGGEGFAIPIVSVKEIVRLPETLVRVPKAGSGVEGVFNLRGAVLPIVDLRNRLGMAQIERNDRQRIMVLLVAGARVGFIVDQVTQVINVPLSAIEAAPTLSGEQGRLIPRVANLAAEGRMIQLIEPEQLAA